MSVIFAQTTPALALRPFAPAQVRLLDGPCKERMERNVQVLLALEPDRFLHNTRKYAGLEPKAPLYGGWEARGIAGHSLGHYLSALSQQIAATGDGRCREKLDYTVAELALCQERYGDGYVGALPPLELAALRGLKEGKVEMKGAWVPWYTEHKVLAGLKDAWVLGGNAQAKIVALKLADFVDAVTAGLTPDQQQAMLRMEFGGMNETLVELAALSRNPHYLAVSRRFSHQALLNPLLAGRDELAGKHANTQIPKVIGEAVRYETTGAPEGRRIAENFWDLVVNHHSFVTGGDSDYEHFFPTGKFAEHLGPQAAESCNTYNMLKLTEHLLAWEPKVAYGDYYERALYNHIWATQEPRQGMFTYFMSLRPGHCHTYSTPRDSFWCCVGTGMENHTRYGAAIYFHGANELYVNLYIPSELHWQERGLILEQRTRYPESEQVELTVKAAPATELALRLRCPAWATGPLAVTLNGQPLNVTSVPGQWAEVRGAWQAGDRLQLTIPMGLRSEALPGVPGKVALLYGPLVLAGDLGPVPESGRFPYARDHRENERAPAATVPVLVAESVTAALQAVRRQPGEALAFRTEGLGRPAEITLRPYKDLPYNYYNVYWDLLTPAAWQSQEATRAAAAAQAQREAARIVDELRPGEQQSEVDHGLAGERSFTGNFNDRMWRDARAGGFFEFRLKVLPEVPQALRCTYWGDDTGPRTFDILANGNKLATQTLNRNRPRQFFDVEYPLPPEMLAGQERLAIRMQAHPNCFAGGLFHCAIVTIEPKRKE